MKKLTGHLEEKKANGMPQLIIIQLTESVRLSGTRLI